jgi:hypothetical protein
VEILEYKNEQQDQEQLIQVVEAEHLLEDLVYLVVEVQE